MLVHKYIMKVISNIVAAVASFIALMVMTRYVGAEYGVMMWGFAFVALFNAVAGLGFETAHIKFVAEGKDQNNCFSTYAVIRSLLTGLMVIFTVAFTIIGIYNGSINMELATVIFIFIVYYAVWDIRSILTVTFDARLETGKSSIVIIVESVVRSAILIALALMQASVDVLSLAYIIGMVIAAITSLALCRNIGVRLVRPTMFKEYVKYTAPLVISSLTLLIVEALDKVMIGFNGDALEVGYYAAAMGAVVAVVALGNSMNNVILPQLSSPEMASSRSKSEGLVWMSQKYLLMFLFPIMAVLMVYGPVIASVLFGSDYSKAGLILSILGIMMVMKVLSGVLSQVLYASNNARLYTKASVIYCIFVTALYFVFIPDNGVWIWAGGVGAALAVSIGSLLYIVLLIYYVKNAAGIRVYPNLWKHVVSLIVTLAVLVSLWYYFDVSGPIWMIMVSMLGLLVYFAVLVILKELRGSDIKFFMNAMSPKQLMKSLDEELH